jgi:hypothetical protein
MARLQEKLQEIRNALDDDAVFNVIGEVLPAAHIERVLRDYYSGKLGDADLEERLLHNVDEGQFRAICQNALEGLATKRFNLDLLIERRAQAQERRVVPETIARFIQDTAGYANLTIKPIPTLAHTFEPGRTPPILKQYERSTGWRLPSLATRYTRCSTERQVADQYNLEWITPGHPLFEALRLHTFELAGEAFSKGGCYYSLEHDWPARVDFYRAQVVDGLGQVIHERLFAIEIGEGCEPCLREPAQLLGNFTPAHAPNDLPPIVESALPSEWLHQKVLLPFLEEVRQEHGQEIERIAEYIEISLTELIGKVDSEIGRAAAEVELGVQGAEGRLAQAENRHAELMRRRERRRGELDQQRSMTLQSVERLASALILPHPEREAPDVRHLRPDYETEAIAMRVVIEHEQGRGCQVYDVHEKNLGYDVTSLDLETGELRLIEVKGIGADYGTILLSPNERRVAEDRRDCYWLYVVTNCKHEPVLHEPIRDPGRFPWHEVVKVQHYWLEVDALKRPIEIRERKEPYESG